MATTEVGFKINIDGINSINDLNKAISDTQKQLNAAEDAVERFSLQEKLAKLKAEQTAVRKQQDDLNKSFIEQSNAIGSYDQLSAKLNRLRKEYKNLAVTEQENTEQARALLEEIQLLDSTLKKADASVGQFQRNVGNYPEPDYSSLISDLNKLQQEYNQLTEEQKASSEQAKILKSQIDSLDAEVKNITSSYDKLSAENNKLKKRYKELALQNKENTKEAKELKKQIDDLDKTLKKADGSIGETTTSFDSAKTAAVKFIPGLEDLNNKFKESGVSSNAFSIALIGAFAAFQAASAIIKVIGDLNTFNKELDRTAQQLKALTGVSGEELDGLQNNITALSKTFEVDSKTIIDSAKQISEKTGVSFEDAIGQIENGLLKGNESADAFLSGIAEIPEAYADVSEASGKFADKQKSLLETNKELAESQAEGARKFEKVGSVLENLGSQIQTYLIDTFLYLYDNVLTPFYNGAIKPLVDAFNDLFKSLGGGGVVLGYLTKAFQIMLLPTKIAYQTITLFVSALAKVIEYGRKAGEFIGIFGKQTDAATKSTRNFYSETTKGITDAFKIAEEFEAKRAKQEQDAIEARKKQAEAIKQANEEAKREADQLAKDRQKFLDEENKFTESALKVNQQIIEKTNQLITDNITNEYEKRRQIVKENAAKELEEIKNNIAEQTKADKEREAEALKLFREGSKELAKARQTTIDNEKKNKEELSDFEKNLAFQTADQLLAIDKELNQKRIDENKKFHDAKLKNIDRNYNDEKNRLEMQLAWETKGLDENDSKRIQAEEKFSKQIYEIEKKRLEDTLKLNQNLLANNKDLTDEEQSNIVSKNIEINSELAKLENDRTKTVKDEINKRTGLQNEEFEERKKKINAALDAAQEYAMLGIEVVNAFAQASEQKRMERLNMEEEANQKAIDSLNERLSTASGLERRYLQQQLEEETKNAENIAKEKEKAEKASAKREKAIAVIQSIINGAVAIGKAIASAPPPFNIPAIVAASIQSAAQTAIISAQPLAKGGVVGKGDEIVQFSNGGKVTSRGNIKPLSNGDNVLATLKTGEVVLNEKQQRRIGFATLKKAQIPNFATGGFVGAPTSLITSSNNAIASEKMQGDLMQGLIEATNSRIDRLSVVYTATTDYEVEKGRNDKKSIKANSTF